jgi:CPA2 family monovalent cation:H+ antiporter-2
MHGVDFIKDLAVIMLTAGVVTVIFHYLKQPVVLGYIIAGLIIGPYTTAVPFISD